MMQKRVVVVDDEILICWTLSKALRKDGYEVECFQNAEDALLGIRGNPPQLVLLDLRLPGRSGIELLADLKVEFPQINAIMISAFGTEEVRQQAKTLGVAGFFDKPFDLPRLKGVIAEVFRDCRKVSH